MWRNTRGEVDGGALVAIVLLIIALLGAFYLLFIREGGGDDEVDIRVDLPDTIGLAPPSARSPAVTPLLAYAPAPPQALEGAGRGSARLS